MNIHDNTFENNVFGLFHDKGHDNAIKNNKFHNSEQIAISLNIPNNSTVENNYITGSKMIGIALNEGSINNFIVSNNLKDNKVDIDSSLSPEENNQFSDNICKESLPEGLCD